MDLDALHHHLFPEKVDVPCQASSDYEFMHKELHSKTYWERVCSRLPAGKQALFHVLAILQAVPWLCRPAYPYHAHPS